MLSKAAVFLSLHLVLRRNVDYPIRAMLHNGVGTSKSCHEGLVSGVATDGMPCNEIIIIED